MPLLESEYFLKGYNAAYQALGANRPPNTEVKIPSSCKRNYDSFEEFAANLTAYYNGYNSYWAKKGFVPPVTQEALSAVINLHLLRFQGEQAQHQIDPNPFENNAYCFNRGYEAANISRINNLFPITRPKIPFSCKKDIQSYDDFVAKVISYYNGYNKAWTDYGYAGPITLQALEEMINSNETQCIIQALLHLPVAANALALGSDRYFISGKHAASQAFNCKLNPATIPSHRYSCKHDNPSTPVYCARLRKYYTGYNDAWMGYGQTTPPIPAEALEAFIQSLMNPTLTVLADNIAAVTIAPEEAPPVTTQIPLGGLTSDQGSPRTDNASPTSSGSSREQPSPRSGAQCAKKHDLDLDDVYITLADFLQQPEMAQPDPVVSLADDALVLSFLNPHAEIGPQASVIDNNLARSNTFKIN